MIVSELKAEGTQGCFAKVRKKASRKLKLTSTKLRGKLISLVTNNDCLIQSWMSSDVDLVWYK